MREAQTLAVEKDTLECLLTGYNIEWGFFLAKKPKWRRKTTSG